MEENKNKQEETTVENTDLGPGKTVEDYLEAILMVRESQGYVRSIDIATELDVTKPSVTYATKKLQAAGYLDRDAHGMLVLTESGYQIAQSTLNRHNKLTAFFTYLGVDPAVAKEDACLVEHDLSEETFQALCRHVDELMKQ